MSIYTESQLKDNQSYMVQEVSHFPSKLKFLVGNRVLLNTIDNTTASVRKVQNHHIPARSLIHVPEYVCKSVNSKNADGFAVVAREKNSPYPVGTAFLNPIKVTSTHFTVIHNGKELVVPLDIVCSLVKVKKLEKPINVAKVAKKTGVDPRVIEVLDEMLAPHGNRTDINEIPAALTKLLPGINLVELRDIILADEDEEHWDYDGNLHTSLIEVDKANRKIRHRKLTNKLIAIASTNLLLEAQAIRDAN